MSGPVYIFAGGGTGGHLYPGIAVAEELMRIRPDAKVVFSCSSRQIDRRILDALPYAVVPQPIRPLPQSLAQGPSFLVAWWRSGTLARDMIRDLNPAAALGLGGFAAAPVVTQARKVRLRTAMLNPDAVPGKANRHLAGSAEVIFTQFESTRSHFSAGAQGKVRCVGCPVRKSLLAGDLRDAIRHFGLEQGLKTLLVLGGSLGAESINEAFVALAGDLGGFSDTWQVLHVTGPRKAGLDEKARATGGLAVRSLSYCHRMDLAYAAADLAVCRSGAVTVAELAATGTPAVLVPYPYHADQHQRLNAGGLAEAGAARVCLDARNAQENARTLREVLIPILRDPSVLQAMRQAAAGLGKPCGAQVVAEWLAG